MAVFLATVLASLVFYLKTEAKVLWQKLTSPLVISEKTSPAQFDPNPVLTEIKNLTKELRGTYGVYVYRWEDGQEYGLHQTEVFPAASLVKLPAMVALYQEADAANLDLETEYILKEADKISGAGILQNKPAGSTYTYRQLAEYMGQYSDNTAFGILREELGEARIEKAVHDLGLERTSLKKNETTPEDIGVFFRQLYEGEVVKPEYQEEILAFLTNTGFEDRIPAGIPEGTRVAHKIGTEIGSFSDGGIVFADPPPPEADGGFVLVIMSRDARENEAAEVLPQIAKAVWDFETVDKTRE